MGCLLVISIAYAQTKLNDNTYVSNNEIQIKTTGGQAQSRIISPNIPKDSGIAKPTRIQEAPLSGQRSPDEVVAYIQAECHEFGIECTIPLRIAYCESHYHWNSKNSSSTASGVYQFLVSTWAGTPEGKAGLSPFDAYANVRAAIRKIAEGGIGAWNASRSCWDK